MANKKLLRIKNFRSLEDVELEIRPLTFLFGKNGSGKSSVLKAIKLLGENTLPLEYNKSTKYDFKEFNLGNFREIVTKNDSSRKIEMEFSVLEKPFANWVEDQKRSSPEKRTEMISTYQKILDNKSFSGKTFRVQFGDDPQGINLKQFEFGYVYANEAPIIYSYSFNDLTKGKDILFDSTNEELSRTDVVRDIFTWLLRYWGDEMNLFYRDWGTGHPDDPITEIERIADDAKLEEDIKSLLFELYKDFLLNFLEDIISVFSKRYFSTSRLKPYFRYFLNYSKFEDNEYYGLLNKLSDDHELSGSINKIVKELDLAKEIKVEKHGEVGKLILVSESNSTCNFAEANSGIQRSLPIIAFNELYEKINILLEQPEIELHPKLQCQLIEYLSKGKNNYIIETHSEHIIRKIQVMIANGDLKEEKVAVYYFDKDKSTGTTSIKEMELEDNGFFKEPWPDGFFDDSYNLARELIYARKN
jgi:predicted ATPase